MNQAQAEAPAPRRFDDIVTFGTLRAATDEELTAISPMRVRWCTRRRTETCAGRCTPTRTRTSSGCTAS